MLFSANVSNSDRFPLLKVSYRYSDHKVYCLETKLCIPLIVIYAFSRGAKEMLLEDLQT